ncbi:hypothetical protein DPMN_148667 [Dreissena polymorpha]|uniref:Uncharacterized protein n=1 Tax=Dreissena polymorpha TaxID=45954 RepID=A0A9D4FC67_DREPO|nr:hypothetical protein DPMN_148667 [Dreissena polymorpha]
MNSSILDCPNAQDCLELCLSQLTSDSFLHYAAKMYCTCYKNLLLSGFSLLREFAVVVEAADNDNADD